MKIGKLGAFFCLGGLGYVSLELLWRGRSHISMFLAGGTCFLLLGQLSRAPWPIGLKCLLGAGMITSIELLSGFLWNSSYHVWDYRGMPLNFCGQICLPFSLLWIPVSLGGMLLYGFLEKKLTPQR